MGEWTRDFLPQLFPNICATANRFRFEVFRVRIGLWVNKHFFFFRYLSHAITEYIRDNWLKTQSIMNSSSFFLFSSCITFIKACLLSTMPNLAHDSMMDVYLMLKFRQLFKWVPPPIWCLTCCRGRCFNN